MVGLFINTLPLRAKLLPEESLAAFLKGLQERQSSLMAYQYLGLAEIQALSGLGELFDTLLVFENYPVDRDSFAVNANGMRLTGAAGQDATHYPLSLAAIPGDRLLLRFTYRPDLFDRGSVEVLGARLLRLLESAAATPERPIGSLDVLSAAERRRILEEWNDTTRPLVPATLPDLFVAQAERTPDAIAVVFEGKSLSYGALNRAANQVAHRLRKCGVGPESVVGLCLNRSLEMIVGLLGILKAGAAYLPLDPAYPEQRLAGMLAQTATRVLVTEESLAARFAGLGPHAVVLGAAADPTGDLPAAAGPAGDDGSGGSAGSADDAGSARDVRDAGNRVGPADLIYAIFTSGSTGQPKAVLLDHRGRVNNFTDFNRRFAVGPGDRLLALSSLSFDMSAYDLLGVLAAGATVVLPGPEEAREPAAWAELIARHRVTLWHSVPAMLEMLLDHLAVHPGQSLAPLRLVLLGGDWIPVTMPDRVRRHGTGIEVISLGGATEVSMDSVIYRVGDVAPGWRSIPYGRPMANQTAYVLDPELEPVPVGVVGELHLGGAGVGWGYLGQAGLTAARFVPDALAGMPGDRLYKTGDLARTFADGTVELLGRLDNQIKIRGLRVEVGEIEATLRRLPGVREAVVTARPDGRGERRLVAYVVPAAGATVAAAEIKDSLRQSLPGYMVPAAVMVIAALPLTPNGKLDRAALPAPAERAGSEEAFVAPQGPLENLLAGIWLDVLGVEQVGAHDDFFDLGGHSLLATRVVTRLAEVLPLEVPLRVLFEAPTLTQQAARLAVLAGPARGEIERIAQILLEVDEAADDGGE
jgi:amino acid adenylation domain-containing protein